MARRAKEEVPQIVETRTPQGHYHFLFINKDERLLAEAREYVLASARGERVTSDDLDDGSLWPLWAVTFHDKADAAMFKLRYFEFFRDGDTALD